jgi:NodT family efflux transporter outer membrane factor (OMF) lipoprotein
MKKFLLLPLALALASCAGFDKDASPRPTLVDAAALGAQASDVAWPTEDWWHRYNDPQLNTLIDEAIAGSPTLVTAQARLLRAQSSTETAHASQLPRVSGSFDATRERYTALGIIPPPIGGTIQTDSNLSLNISYELDFWNKNGLLFQAAVSQTRAAEAEARAARSILASSVAGAYFNLQRDFAQRDVLRDAIKQRDEVAKLTLQRFNGGLDTRVEVKQAESALAEARTQSAQVDESLALDRNQIAALIGAGPEHTASLQPIALQAPGTSIPAQIPLSLLGRRADIVASRWRVEAADRDADAAKTLFYPDINLSAFAGLASLGLNNLFKSDSRMYGAGPAISLPIFEGGRLNANLKGRRADTDLAIATYNQTVLNAVHEVADALDSIRALDRESTEQRHARDAIQEAYDLALRRYRAGLGNYLTVLTAQSAVLTQSRLDADLKARALTLDVALARALGGGVQLPASLTDVPNTVASGSR